MVGPAGCSMPGGSRTCHEFVGSGRASGDRPARRTAGRTRRRVGCRRNGLPSTVWGSDEATRRGDGGWSEPVDVQLEGADGRGAIYCEIKVRTFWTAGPGMEVGQHCGTVL